VWLRVPVLGHEVESPLALVLPVLGAENADCWKLTQLRRLLAAEWYSALENLSSSPDQL